MPLLTELREDLVKRCYNDAAPTALLNPNGITAFSAVLRGTIYAGKRRPSPFNPCMGGTSVLSLFVFLAFFAANFGIRCRGNEGWRENWWLLFDGCWHFCREPWTKSALTRLGGLEGENHYFQPPSTRKPFLFKGPFCKWTCSADSPSSAPEFFRHNPTPSCFCVVQNVARMAKSISIGVSWKTGG